MRGKWTFAVLLAIDIAASAPSSGAARHPSTPPRSARSRSGQALLPEGEGLAPSGPLPLGEGQRRSAAPCRCRGTKVDLYRGSLRAELPEVVVDVLVDQLAPLLA